MRRPRWGRPHSLVSALVLALCAALMLAAAAPASAITRKQAAKKALAALGSSNGSDPVIVFGLRKPVRVGTSVTQAGGTKSSPIVGRFGHQRAFFFYEDSGPFQVYPHTGRVALVGAKSGKVKLSKRISWAPLVNGKRPAFLTNSKNYSASKYRVFYRAWSKPATPVRYKTNSHPKADTQDATVKKNVPKNIVLTGSDDDGDPITFAITQQPDHGTLSGQPPYVTYTPNANYLGKDKFAFKTYDDTDQSNTAHVSIDVVPLGNRSTVTASPACTAYTEHTAAVAVDGQLTASDSDDTQLDSARVRISANFQDGDDLLFTDQNGIAGSYDDATGVLTLTGTSSVANYQAALRTVRYRNLASRNLSATKSVAFTTNDAGGDSAPATKQICTTGGSAGGNDPPNGTLSEGAASYIENDGPVPVDAGFSLGDPDSATLTGATIQLISRPGKPAEPDELGNPGTATPDSHFFPGEDVLAYTDLENGITSSYDSETGTLALSGAASVAAYETAIQSVTYENTSENPSADPRTVRIKVTDAGGLTSSPSTRDIFVTPVNDAPVTTTTEGSASYVGTGPGTTIDAGLTVGDVDDTNIESAQVRISSGFASGDDLVYVNQHGISGLYGTGTGILTLTGPASVADYQTALRSIKYRHTGGNPSGSRTVEFTVNDGDLDSGAATKNIEVNDKPVLGTTGSALSYSEGDGSVAVDTGVTAADADSVELSGATVQITSNFSQAQDTLSLAEQNGITGSYAADTGTLTLSGTASVAQYQAALGDVRYQNSSDDPSTATRTVTFQVDDGATTNNLSDPVTRDIEITPVNDAPVVTTSDGSASYTIGDSVGQQVDPALTVADVDDANIEGAQVRISSGFEAGDELVLAEQPAISGSYNSDTGVLTLTGPASVADYETALHSISYRHTGDNPSASRTVEFTVNDGDADSNAALKSIDVTPPSTDAAPVVTTSAGSTSYVLGDSAGAVVDNALTVTDADDTNIESARVQVEGFEPGDDLVWGDQLNITGTFDSEIGVLTLTGSAPLADYETALRSIKFRHFGDNQSAFRHVAFKVNDGDLDSSFSLKAIDLTAPQA